MATISATVEMLEIIILAPMFIAFTAIFYRSATSILKFTKMASGSFSVVLSALIMAGLKKHIVVTVLLPFAVLGTVFFLIPLCSFIVRTHRDRAK